MQQGDTFTIEGQYARRTLWQWLTLRPRRLQVFTITASIDLSDVQLPSEPPHA